ncbi:MAG TPA: FxLYD domain-containing protein [Acidimicrobiales bacterium]
MRSAPRLLFAGLVLAGIALSGAGLVAGAANPVPRPGLPELPSVSEQVAGLYDGDGCLRTGAGPGDVDCSVRADEVDEALSHGGAREPRLLQGFSGTHWLGQVDGRGPRVLPESVLLSAGGAFTASGLARNEGTEVLSTLSVTARLVDGAGTELDEVTVTSPVRNVRPGEPVPFAVSSPVAASTVDRVEWSATGGATGDESTRALSWTPFWERPVDGDPVALYLYRDGAGRRPHLLFGSVTAVGGTGVDRPEVVVAQVSADGRLVSLVTASVRGPDGSPVAHLDAGAAGDALVVAADDPPADGETMVWVQGS